MHKQYFVTCIGTKSKSKKIGILRGLMTKYDIVQTEGFQVAKIWFDWAVNGKPYTVCEKP